MNQKWWKEAVVYQIYPMSFNDSNGDGIGDLQGIIAKLDYLKELGVDVIWLAPIYQSPNDDNGYDISDYQAIDPRYGTLADWDELLREIHQRGMKLIMDLVINHTSDEHPWFIESRSDIKNPKRDYYIWRPSRNGKEPNNWESFFGGSAWEYDVRTGEYYLHLYSKKQPDLNWENPCLKREVFQMIQWWLDKGIDGFRMDVINRIVKPAGLPDSPKAPTHQLGYVFDRELLANQPGVHEVLRELNKAVLSNYEIMTVGEANNVNPDIALQYVKDSRRELDMLLHFEAVNLLKMDLLKFKEIQWQWYRVIRENGWNTQYLSNHDQPRQLSKFGNDTRYRVEAAKLLGTVLHTLPGTPFIYQGEEIGMTNVAFPSIEQYCDISTKNKYWKLLAEGFSAEEALQKIQPISRDNARTPMQWNDGINAGFSDSRPWLDINPNYASINVRHDLENPDSIFYYYQRLIQLRKKNLVMVYGSYQPLLEDDPEIMAYIREYGDQRWLVMANFSENQVTCALPGDIQCLPKQLLLANLAVDEQEVSPEVRLRPFEARIYGLNK